MSLEEYESWGTLKMTIAKTINQIQVKSWLHWSNPHTDNLPNEDVCQFPGINTISSDPTVQ